MHPMMGAGPQPMGVGGPQPMGVGGPQPIMAPMSQSSNKVPRAKGLVPLQPRCGRTANPHPNPHPHPNPPNPHPPHSPLPTRHYPLTPPLILTWGRLGAPPQWSMVAPPPLPPPPLPPLMPLPPSPLSRVGELPHTDCSVPGCTAVHDELGIPLIPVRRALSNLNLTLTTDPNRDPNSHPNPDPNPNPNPNPRPNPNSGPAG